MDRDRTYRLGSTPIHAEWHSSCQYIGSAISPFCWPGAILEGSWTENKRPECRTPAVQLTATPHFDFTALIGLPNQPNAQAASLQKGATVDHLLHSSVLLHIVAISQPHHSSHTNAHGHHEHSQQSHGHAPVAQPTQDHQSGEQGQGSTPIDSHALEKHDQMAASEVKQGMRPIHPQDSLPSYLAAKHASSSHHYQTESAKAPAAASPEQALRPKHPQDSLPSYLAAKHTQGSQQRHSNAASSAAAQVSEPALANGKPAAPMGRMGRERRESTASDASDDQWLTDAMVEEGQGHARPQAKHSHSSHEGQRTCIGVCRIDWRQVNPAFLDPCEF